jgi:hypothetical protein
MFINCPFCRALVATDPVTDQPPTHCPHCDSLLRRDPDAPIDADEAEERPPLDMAALLNAPDLPRAAPHPAERDDAAAGETVATETAAIAAGMQAGTLDANTSHADEFDPDTSAANAATAAPTIGDPAPQAAAAAPPRTRAARAMPSFVRGPTGTGAGRRERWVIAAVVALALLLALQLLLADRARLAGDARWRPLLLALCAPLRCELPPWREAAAFTLLQRDVRQHPTRAGALRVSAAFRNDARWSQPWPRLKLTLSDANGRPAGERSFDAEEYLGGAPSQAELASGESATVAMDILEPASGIVGYDFSFR